MRQTDTIYGYHDSLFFRSAQQIVNSRFGGDIKYLPITMKMLLHDVAMLALERAQLLQGVVFQGGTCLQRVYNWSRLSENLDFTNIAELTENHFIEFGNSFGDAIRTELSKLGFSDGQITVKQPKNMAWPGKAEPEIRKWSMRVNVGPRSMKQVVNIELANMPSYNHAPMFFTPLSNAIGARRLMVNVEPLNVIFNDKLISIIQRPYLKYRDIYDVGLLSDREHLDEALFISKMRDRAFSDEYVAGRIDAINDQLESKECIEAFKNEMTRFIIPGTSCDIHDNETVRVIIGKTLASLATVKGMLELEDVEEDSVPRP